MILIVLVFLNCVVLNNISARIGLPTLLAFIVLGIVFGNVGAISVYLSVRAIFGRFFAFKSCHPFPENSFSDRHNTPPARVRAPVRTKGCGSLLFLPVFQVVVQDSGQVSETIYVLLLAMQGLLQTFQLKLHLFPFPFGVFELLSPFFQFFL